MYVFILCKCYRKREYKNKVVLERDNRLAFESNIDLKEIKKAIIEFIRNSKEEV